MTAAIWEPREPAFGELIKEYRSRSPSEMPLISKPSTHRWHSESVRSHTPGSGISGQFVLVSFSAVADGFEDVVGFPRPAGVGWQPPKSIGDHQMSAELGSYLLEAWRKARTPSENTTPLCPAEDGITVSYRFFVLLSCGVVKASRADTRNAGGV